ncbi:hypothetical protein C2G38_1588577 [Gigaspora rosea]|uniref:DUF1264-domain-containing protein n=1 Tax=Gigaspora rosea TaxID=44941 RepID=A0A397UYJ3_9GLOM|nr:hypothetical protein C2G38_1588577 [Gigaspora rosea]
MSETCPNPPHPGPPGEKLSATQNMLGTAVDVAQSFDPFKKIHEHVCAFHFYSHDMTRQVEAHHYCSHLNDDFRQCIIYDSNKADAKLIGVEYIISAKLFQTLSEEEKKYWHSHNYEVKSGILVCPVGSLIPASVADKAEEKIMEDLINTYGKTWHFWQVDRGDPLPLGPPQLMMAFTEDNQLSPKALKCRDEKLNISTAHKRETRAHLRETYKCDPCANHWASRDDNKSYQCDMKLVEQKKVV